MHREDESHLLLESRKLTTVSEDGYFRVFLGLSVARTGHIGGALTTFPEKRHRIRESRPKFDLSQSVATHNRQSELV